MLINAGAEAAAFVLPRGQWQAVLDSSHRRGMAYQTGTGGKSLWVGANSLMLFQQISGKSTAVYPFETSVLAPLTNLSGLDPLL
jgi:hypothetical protein